MNAFEEVKINISSNKSSKRHCSHNLFECKKTVKKFWIDAVFEIFYIYLFLKAFKKFTKKIVIFTNHIKLLNKNLICNLMYTTTVFYNKFLLLSKSINF